MTKDTGVFQLPTGYWGYRFVISKNGRCKNYRRVQDEFGEPFKTRKQAARARQQAIIKANIALEQKVVITRRTFAEVFEEYCEKGRADKAYATIRKQDSLWNNHLKNRFGKRYVDQISVAEVKDYLAELYYVEGRAYGYVESFVKMFYLIFGQAYSRNYMDVDTYNKLCVNKDTKIKMPKRKVDDDDEIVVFSNEELEALDNYFKGTTLETAYMLGRYCGLRINECFGLKWQDIDFDAGTITISRQMQYQNGVIKLVPVKTRNGRRTIYMAEPLRKYLLDYQTEIDNAMNMLSEMRTQQQMFIKDSDGFTISSLDLVNTLPNGKMRTVNSMKRHTIQTVPLIICFTYLNRTESVNITGSVI